MSNQSDVTPDTSSRRWFLARTAVVAGAIGLTGCLSTGTDANDGGTTTNASTSADANATTGASSTESGTSTTASDGNVTFEAPHGATIEATAYGSGDCGVVLVPQINKDRESWQPLAETIADLGHLVLAIDEDPDNRPASVRGAIQYLHEEQNVSSLVLVGASTGGEAVVVANAETDATVDATVTLSAAGGVDHAADLQGHALFVVATGDEDRFVSTAQELHDKAPGPKALVEYDGSAHGQGLLVSEYADDLRQRLETLLADVCAD